LFWNRPDTDLLGYVVNIDFQIIGFDEENIFLDLDMVVGNLRQQGE